MKANPILLLAAWLVGCGNGVSPGQIPAGGARVAPAQAARPVGRQEILLVSDWVRVRLHMDAASLDPRFEPARARQGIRWVGFGLGLDLRGNRPTTAGRDDDPNVVSALLETNAPNFITRQLDPGYDNHYSIYRPTGQRRFGLEYRPSSQIELDGGFLLTGAERAFPVMIECYLRPRGLPTRCQLWQRRQAGLTLVIHFNGARIADWEAILNQIERFVVPNIDSIEPRTEAANAL